MVHRQIRYTHRPVCQPFIHPLCRRAGETYSGHFIDLDLSDWTVLVFDFTFDIFSHVQIPVPLSLPVAVSRALHVEYDQLTRQG